ncbi:MAG: cell wall hydrolase [Mesorhizobium sp.]
MSIFHRLVALRRNIPALLGILISPLLLAGCSQTTGSISTASLTDSIKPGFLGSRTYGYTTKDRGCLARAMFFESNRSSRDGMVAVGTVVMNRLRSGQHGDTICAVVGEKRQFAPGVLSRPMNSKALPDVMAAADAVLKGERAPKLKNAMHFHTAGLKFPYKNMHYIEVAGGNAFYEKRGRNWEPLPAEKITMVALNGPTPSTPASASASEAMMASAGALPGVKVADETSASTQLADAAPLPTPRSAVAKVDAQPRSSEQEQSGKQGRAVLVAMQEPSSDRFGSSDFDTARPKSIPFQTASADAEQPTLGFQSTPDDTNAVAAMIMSENGLGQ